MVYTIPYRPFRPICRRHVTITPCDTAWCMAARDPTYPRIQQRCPLLCSLEKQTTPGLSRVLPLPVACDCTRADQGTQRRSAVGTALERAAHHTALRSLRRPRCPLAAACLRQRQRQRQSDAWSHVPTRTNAAARTADGPVLKVRPLAHHQHCLTIRHVPRYDKVLPQLQLLLASDVRRLQADRTNTQPHTPARPSIVPQ
jgi:hypothetical protein